MYIYKTSKINRFWL